MINWENKGPGTFDGSVTPFRNSLERPAPQDQTRLNYCNANRTKGNTKRTIY